MNKQLPAGRIEIFKPTLPARYDEYGVRIDHEVTPLDVDGMEYPQSQYEREMETEITCDSE